MKAEFRKSFSRDLKRRKRDKLFLNNVREIIEEVERAKNINEVKNLKHLKGYTEFYLNSFWGTKDAID